MTKKTITGVILELTCLNCNRVTVITSPHFWRTGHKYCPHCGSQEGVLKILEVEAINSDLESELEASG